MAKTPRARPQRIDAHFGGAINPQATTVWSVSLVRRMPREYDDSHGAAFYDAQQIYVQRGESAQQTLDTLFHEMAHAELPDLSEDAVGRLARHFAVVLLELDLIKQAKLRA